ncbi:MAG: hypothetical protein WCJ17_03245 [bacterium]
MKNLLIALTGSLLLFTMMQASEQSSQGMVWSPIPEPHPHALLPSPTLLSADSIAEAELPANRDIVLGIPSIQATATYSDHKLYGEESGIVLRVPTGADMALGACTLVINNEIKGLIVFNEAGLLSWNTEHLALIQAARSA